jgi:hypothetical protein
VKEVARPLVLGKGLNLTLGFEASTLSPVDMIKR